MWPEAVAEKKSNTYIPQPHGYYSCEKKFRLGLDSCKSIFHEIVYICFLFNVQFHNYSNQHDFLLLSNQIGLFMGLFCNLDDPVPSIKAGGGGAFIF